MLKANRWWISFVVSVLLAPMAEAQVPPQPGPEHERLKELEGTWDATFMAGTEESKGTMTSKIELGGLWLVNDFQGDFAGQGFTGKGLETYDPAKKKYVSVWVDSMSTSPMISEGSFDQDKNVLTMIGEGPGPDGKPTKYKMTTHYKDKDSFVWTMFGTGPDGEEAAMMSISYKRRK